jgi:hypothetical protein
MSGRWEELDFAEGKDLFSSLSLICENEYVAFPFLAN